MIKVKIYKLSEGHRIIGGNHLPVSDYMYTVNFFGFIVWSVTMHDIDHKTASQVFKKYTISKA